MFGLLNALRQIRDTFAPTPPAGYDHQPEVDLSVIEPHEDEEARSTHTGYPPKPSPPHLSPGTWADHIGWHVRYDHPGSVEHGTLTAVATTARSEQLIAHVLFDNAVVPVPVDPEYLWLVRPGVDPERTPIELAGTGSERTYSRNTWPPPEKRLSAPTGWIAERQGLHQALHARNRAYGRASATIGALRGENARLRERLAEIEGRG